MKRLKIFIIAILLTLYGNGQIHPYLGIYDKDSCHFEPACDLTTLSDTAHGLWQIGKSLKPFFGAGFSPPFAIMTDTINPYPGSIHTYFDLVVPDGYWGNMILGFKHKYQTDTLRDGGYIEISYDSGRHWFNVLEEAKRRPTAGLIQFNMENMYSQKDSLTEGKTGFSGNSNGWIYSRIQWVWFIPVGPDDKIIRFHFISDSVNHEKEGWIIDDLLLSWADLGSSVKRNATSKQLKYYPNPLVDESVFEFDNPKKEEFTLRLYNDQGQLVRTESESHPERIILKRGDLNSGLYCFILKSNSGIQTTGNLMVK